MSKHDSWIEINAPSFEPMRPSFPEGVPTRDPFPMALQGNWLIGRIIDLERLTDEQFEKFTEFVAKQAGVAVEIVRACKERNEHLCINEKIVYFTHFGPEGFCRLIEFVLFNHENPADSPNTQAALRKFMEDKDNRWIQGNEQPDIHCWFKKLPENLKDEELTEIYRKFLVEERLNSGIFSIEEILSGDALVKALNEIHPEGEYSKITAFEITDDDRN